MNNKKYVVIAKEVIDVVNLGYVNKLIEQNLKFWFKSSLPVKEVISGENEKQKFVIYIERWKTR